MIQRFIRTDTWNYSKLGLRRRKKQVYRRAKGCDSKMRLRMKGNPRNINIGFRSEKSGRDLINNLKPILIFNALQLDSLKKGEIGVIARVGDKNKAEIAKKAMDKKIILVNLNPKKFLKNLEFESKKKKELKKSKAAEKKIKEKKEENKTEIKEEKKPEDSKINNEIKSEEKKQKQIKTDVQTNNYGRGK
jgi:large subunit ribosomal protein L32e